MDSININKRDGIKTIRRLYSAVNELVDILGRDVSERGYDKNTLEKKIQAYVNYFDDNKELTKGENSDKNSLIIKVEDDVSDIVSLSSSKEDAKNARKALRELSDVASSDLMDVLKSCIDDGGKIGKYTRYAKKKLIMNNVPLIYEKEETNNGIELYYNIVHGKYQILHGDKIYTTKREATEKMQEIDSQENGEIEKTVDVTTEQMEETTGINPIKLEDVKKKSGDIEDIEKSIEQSKKIDTKEENKQLEDEVEGSEEKVVDELKKIQNMKGYEELKRCNDVEFSFLAQQLLKSSEAIDLLKKISKFENSGGNDEELNLEFKSILDKLLANFAVNREYFKDSTINEELTGIKSFRMIRSKFVKQLGVNSGDLNNLQNISEYMAFICCINNIKNSVINLNKQIRGVGKGSLSYLLKGCENEYEMCEKVGKYLGELLSKEIGEFEKLSKKEEIKGMKNKEFSDKMEKLGNKIESDFDLLVLKDGKGEFLEDEEGNCRLSEIVKEKVRSLVSEYRKNGKLNIDDLMHLFLPVFIKMGMFSKNNDIFSHHWFNYIDISNFTSGGNVTDSIIKYVINGKAIELNIGKLKDFEYKYNPLIRCYFDFKNVVLYAIYKTINGNGSCPYGVEFELEEDNKSTFVVYDVVSKGERFFEDSHYGKCLESVFEEDDNIDESSTVQKRNEVDSDEVSEIQKNGEKITENIDQSPGGSIDSTEERNVEEERENNKVKDREKKEESQEKGEDEEKKNSVPEGKENTDTMIEDIIDFYVNNNEEREKLKNLGKNGKKEQRKNYKVKIKNKNWIGLGEIEKIVFGKSSSKPYIDKNFDKILEKLKRLISER